VNLNLVNSRPKRNRHVIGVPPKFARGSNDGPMACSCGDEMLASQFAEHRKAVGEPHAKSSTRVPDMLRGQPSVWKTAAKRRAAA
jgi:hypothetical protein